MITYTDSLYGITTERIDGFFVGWPQPPTPRMHLEIMSRSAFCILAMDEVRGSVVGFITAISDGLLSAYIPLLEVLPEYQRQGIGRELVRRMLEKLKDFYMVDLICDPPLQSFYRALGMRPAVGMSIRNYNRSA